MESSTNWSGARISGGTSTSSLHGTAAKLICYASQKQLPYLTGKKEESDSSRTEHGRGGNAYMLPKGNLF